MYEIIEYEERYAEQIISFFQKMSQIMDWVWSPETLDSDLYKIPEVHRLFLLVICNQEIVGTGALRHIDAMTCELKRDRVLPEHQGKGLGRKLVEMRLEAARKAGYKKAILDTNPKALGFFEKMGFRITSRDGSRYFMEIDLRS